MRGLHEAAAQGYAAAVAHLAAAVGIGRDARVLDVGAGTGKLTRLLVPLAGRVVAVEPVAEMRAALARLVPGCAPVAATAEALPLRAGAVDAAVAGQAFHWFDAPVASAELHRVLVRGGGLGLVWNRRGTHVDWMAELTRVFDAFAGDAPRHRGGEWLQAAFAGSERFAPLELATFDHEHRVGLDAALDRIASVSFVAALPEARRREALARAEAIIAPEVGGDGLVAMPYVTEVYTTSAR